MVRIEFQASPLNTRFWDQVSEFYFQSPRPFHCTAKYFDGQLETFIVESNAFDVPIIEEKEQELERERESGDKVVLLDVGDGPEGIQIYTSNEEGVVDWSGSFPALYVMVSINGASAKFGPFSLASIYEQLMEALN